MLMIWHLQITTVVPPFKKKLQDSLLGDSSSTEAKKALERDLKAPDPPAQNVLPLGGGFKYVLCSPLFGEDFPFD